MKTKDMEVPEMNENVKQNPQLLMIDDDTSVLETFRFWLEGEGYLLHTASSKEEALKLLQDHPVAVCLIDLKLAEENGLEISRELKRFDSLLKVIIITGYPSFQTAIDAMKMGFFDYASKSSENRDILKKIQNAVSVRQEEISSKEDHSGKHKSIILVCHHAMIKEGFENFCREHPEYRLSHSYHSFDYIKPGDFNSSASLVLICHTCSPDVLRQPGKLAPSLRVLFPGAALVMINCNPSDDEKKLLIKHGLKGFLPKNITKENMKKAFSAILKGQIWVSRKVAHELLSELLETSSKHQYVEPQNPYHLSNREIEILQTIASGLSNSEISNKLFISEKTVKAHINHLFKKMEVKSRTKAVKKAVEEHII
ncbi:MAG: response regulator [bacterium]|nr:response regulator [bacterium]